MSFSSDRLSSNDFTDTSKNSYVEKYLKSVLDSAEEKQNTIYFVLVVAAIDPTNQLSICLKEYYSKLLQICKNIDFNELSESSLLEFIDDKNTSLVLNNERIIEKAFKHCILLMSKILIEFLTKHSKKLYYNISVRIELISFLMHSWINSDREQIEEVEDVLKLLLDKDIMLILNNPDELIHGKMTIDFVNNKVLPTSKMMDWEEEDKECFQDKEYFQYK